MGRGCASCGGGYSGYYSGYSRPNPYRHHNPWWWRDDVKDIPSGPNSGLPVGNPYQPVSAGPTSALPTNPYQPVSAGPTYVLPTDNPAQGVPAGPGFVLPLGNLIQPVPTGPAYVIPTMNPAQPIPSGPDTGLPKGLLYPARAGSAYHGKL